LCGVETWGYDFKGTRVDEAMVHIPWKK
jgi:hypothetical protein